MAQFIGGGIIPWYRIESFALFTQKNFAGIMVQISQVLFGVTTFYYTINLIAAYKKEGSQAFWGNKWNWADIATVLLSLFALTLYLLLTFVLVQNMKVKVSQNWIKMNKVKPKSHSIKYHRSTHHRYIWLCKFDCALW